MLDKEKIEEAKEEIFDKEDFYLYSQEVENPNGKNEYLYTEQQIKDAIGLGIRWAIEHFLKDLWHTYDEIPTRKDSNILQFFESYSADSEDNFDEYFELAHTKEGFTQETWEEFVNEGGVPSKWLYIDDLLKGGKK